MMVVETFLGAGMLLEKTDCFRRLLEENSYRLMGSQHLRELIPFIHSQEENKLQDDVKGKFVSIIFDGTTNVCEAMVIVTRFIDEELHIK